MTVGSIELVGKIGAVSEIAGVADIVFWLMIWGENKRISIDSDYLGSVSFRLEQKIQVKAPKSAPPAMKTKNKNNIDCPKVV